MTGGNSTMTEGDSTTMFVPGDVLALLTGMQEMQPGLYVIRRLADGWAALCVVIDDEATERLLVTDREYHVPAAALQLFMPVGIRLVTAA